MNSATTVSISLPALLRAARAAYGEAIRAAMAQAGFTDVPGNGLFVIGAVARGELPMADLVRDLRASKQAAAQLVDTLVARGYLLRVPDTADRRRVRLAASDRGLSAAAVIRAAVARVDAQLAQRVPVATIAHAREVLLALVQIRDQADPIPDEEPER